MNSFRKYHKFPQLDDWYDSATFRNQEDNSNDKKSIKKINFGNANGIEITRYELDHRDLRKLR